MSELGKIFSEIEFPDSKEEYITPEADGLVKTLNRLREHRIGIKEIYLKRKDTSISYYYTEGSLKGQTAILEVTSVEAHGSFVTILLNNEKLLSINANDISYIDWVRLNK